MDHCGLVEQVNLCSNVNGSSAGGCPDSCSMALRGGGGNGLEQCCNNIVQLIRNSTQDGQNQLRCAERSSKGDSLERLNNASEGILKEIHAGTYITNQPMFEFSCSGCIRSVQLAVTTTSVVRDAQGQEKINFLIFANRTTDKIIFERIKKFIWNSSVLMTINNRTLIEYRPSGVAEVCFNRGEVFGFTVEAESGVILLARLAGDSNDIVRNVSTSLPTSECPLLDDYGFYEFGRFAASTDLVLIPLIHIETGKITHALLCTTCSLHYN